MFHATSKGATEALGRSGHQRGTSSARSGFERAGDLNGNIDSVDKVQKAMLERNGKISIVPVNK